MSDHEVQKMLGGFTKEALESLPMGSVVEHGADRWVNGTRQWAMVGAAVFRLSSDLEGATLVSLPVGPDVEDRVSAYLDRRLNDGPIDELPTIYDNDEMAIQIMKIVQGDLPADDPYFRTR